MIGCLSTRNFPFFSTAIILDRVLLCHLRERKKKGVVLLVILFNINPINPSSWSFFTVPSSALSVWPVSSHLETFALPRQQQQRLAWLPPLPEDMNALMPSCSRHGRKSTTRITQRKNPKRVAWRFGWPTTVSHISLFLSLSLHVLVHLRYKRRIIVVFVLDVLGLGTRRSWVVFGLVTRRCRILHKECSDPRHVRMWRRQFGFRFVLIFLIFFISSSSNDLSLAFVCPPSYNDYLICYLYRAHWSSQQPRT